MVIEPFAGSAAISIASGLPYLLAEADPGIRDLFNTGRSTSLAEWRRQVEEIRSFVRSVSGPTNVQIKSELAALSPWQSFIVRVQACGMYVGAANSTLFYPQFASALAKRLDLLSDAESHAALQRCVDCYESYAQLTLFDTEDQTFVVDPPYLGTNGGYAGSDISVEKMREFLSRKQVSPVMVTYGDGAQTTFPDLNWEVVAERKVPRVHASGTITRTEYVAYTRWS